MVSKDVLKGKFAKEWKKYYEVGFLKERGFKRQRCKKCGNHFWAINEQGTCNDSGCVGYTFIGKKLAKSKLSYAETWDAIAKYFGENGHRVIDPYPVICRWRDDLYFTNASIIDFQPYVVRGEVEAPGNPLVVPQPCIRFPDISNVGVTGRHYTNFVMVGQHAFNTEKTGTFYWKDEALMHDYNFLTKALGIKEELVSFKEDVWAGGGNFGASMEYFVEGLELGNCVFMQFEELPNGQSRELKTKVIDMGAGLERFTWITNGTPTSYELIFGPAVEVLKKQTGVKADGKLFLEYSKLAGSLNIDEVKDLKKQRTLIAKQLKVNEEDLFSMLSPLFSVYAVADHLKTLLLAVNDGGLPSNSGGGYNLRMILRRIFALEKEFGWELDYCKIINAHLNQLEPLFPTIVENVASISGPTVLNNVASMRGVPRVKEEILSVLDVIDEEKKKYKNSLEKGRKRVLSRIDQLKREEKELKTDELVKLYESDGIPVEFVEEIAKEANFKFSKPLDFYQFVQTKNEQAKKDSTTAKKIWSLDRYPQTKLLFYESPDLDEFEATVLGVEEAYLIFDETAFYPEGGGQDSDLGQINGKKVLDVQKYANVVLHQVENPDSFRKGQKVMCKIDWDRRLQLTRQHDAAHLLNAACREILGGHVWQAGAGKSYDKAHLDITHYKKISKEELKRIELYVNQLILENHLIHSFFKPRTVAEQEFGFRIYQGGAVPGKTLRIIQVKGIDEEACGGTHGKNTGSIGFFKILKREGVQDGVERIIFTTGMKAVQASQIKDDLVDSVSETFNVSEYDVGAASKRFFDEWKEQRKKIEGFAGKQSEQEGDELNDKVAGKRFYASFLSNLPQSSLFNLAKELTEKHSDLCLALASSENSVEANLVVLCGHKSKENAQEILQKVLKKVKGKGGGSAKIARGIFTDIDSLKKILEALNK